MFHVIYVSTATEPLSQTEFVDMLNAARQRNLSLGLTGLLLYSRERFIQVLEGPESAVTEVYASIQRDSRHKNIDRLRFEAKPERHFSNWSMGFRDLGETLSDVPGISRFLEPGFDTSAFKDDSSDAYQMLMVFRDAHDGPYH